MRLTRPKREKPTATSHANAPPKTAAGTSSPSPDVVTSSSNAPPKHNAQREQLRGIVSRAARAGHSTCASPDAAERD